MRERLDQACGSEELAPCCRSGRDVMESLILAQDERWRRASYMQVERVHRKVGQRQTGE